ncbi:MAG TPA: choice-of-anchor D domain-containing protein, partial [Porticoccus sp.]|nr:choice-of-anchor D domain-containing protein [Porticoccus sp.]
MVPKKGGQKIGRDAESPSLKRGFTMKRISLVLALLFLLVSNSHAGRIGWTNYTEEDGLSSNNIDEIAIDSQGNVWVAALRGLNKFNGLTWEIFTEEHGLATGSPTAIEIDSKGNIWVGGNGVSMFDGSTWTIYTTTGMSLLSTRVYAIAEDSLGNMWFGFNGWERGVSKYDGNSWTTYHQPGKVDIIAVDSDGIIWFVQHYEGEERAVGGLYKFDGSTWTYYSTEDGLAHLQIGDISFDSNGNVWVGTSGGVCKFDGSTWTTYDTTDGLASNIIRAIAVDSQDNIWAGSYNNQAEYYTTLNKFDGINWSSYPPEDGMLNITSPQCISVDSRGNIWVGGWGGVSMLGELPPQPEISLSVTSLSFGNVNVSSSGSESFTINNEGEEPLVVYSINSNSELFSVSPSSTTIPAGQSQIITINYSPITAGNNSATITMTSNDNNEGTLTVSVSGRGIAPEITLSTTSISIDDVTVGGKNSGSFTISNEGTAELFVSSIISNNAMFTVSHSSATILPSQSQTITVTFSPTTAGEKTATITLVCNDSDETTLTVTVTAIGTAPEISLPNNSVNIGYVAIGSVGVGSFTIVNEGNEQLVVSSISSNNAVFSPIPSSAAVAPNDSQVVMLTFAPVAFGEQTGTITILSNDSDEDSLTVSVTGIGGTIEFACGSDTVYRDSTVNVPISINNSIIAIGGGQFVVTPNAATYVTFEEASTTDRTSGWAVSHSASGDGELILFYSGSGGSISPGSGEILTLTYEISSDAPTGTNITLTISDAKISDENQQSINVTLVHGSLTIGGCPLAGDVT